MSVTAVVGALRRGGHPRRTAECCRWRRQQRWPGRWGGHRRAAGYKGVDSKVHPKGSYERRRVRDERERQGRKKGQERERRRKRENTGEFTSPGEFLQDLISRVHVRARVREYARARA